MKVSIVIPTRNGGVLWKRTVSSITRQQAHIDKVVIIDSNSSDDTAITAREIFTDFIAINDIEFDHGGTRNMAAAYIGKDTDIVIFMTQDAILSSSKSLTKLIEVFKDCRVGAAYGRQLPHNNATAIASHARYYNYSQNGYKSSLATIKCMGIKTVFMSNSFSAYRMSVFNELGGFPEKTILCEDMFFAAQAIMAGYKIAYVPEAGVYHSHNYNALDEFKRYFDIGVFHKTEPWIRDVFGGAGGEGKRFLVSEFKYLLKNSPSQIFTSCINNAGKFLGYKLGLNYKKIPLPWILRLSMHTRYWDASKQ